MRKGKDEEVKGQGGKEGKGCPGTTRGVNLQDLTS